MDELKAYFNAVVVADAGAPTALSALATAHATTTTEFPAFVEIMESLGVEDARVVVSAVDAADAICD